VSAIAKTSIELQEIVITSARVVVVMHNPSDQLAKNILRDALGLTCDARTEVEVLAAPQKIDVYSVPDPARATDRVQLGLLGKLSRAPTLFEPFHDTPNLSRVRRCINKQHTWHHELELRARPTAGTPRVDTDLDETKGEVKFPALVVIGPGRPKMVLEAYGCTPVRPGIYHAVWGLVLRVVVLAELPRTRETLLLRMLGAKRVLREALTDLAALPDDSLEKTIVTPLLVHFGLANQRTTNEEEDVSAGIRAWFEDYRQKLRNEARTEGERSLLLRLLRTRFGELPAAAVARIEAADVAALERWSDRVLDAQTLAAVFGDPS
jgi:Domain of unknown function (DUF4351)